MKRFAIAMGAALALAMLSPVWAQDPPASVTAVEEPAAAEDTVAEEIATAPETSIDTGGGDVIVADDTIATIPGGQMISDILELARGALATALLGGLAWFSRALPSSIWGILQAGRVEQLAMRALDGGINAVQGAVKDKKMDVDLGNKVLARAVEIAVSSTSAGLKKYMGGEDGIRLKLFSRMNLDESASAEKMGVRTNAG